MFIGNRVTGGNDDFMKIANLREMLKGWFIGPFEPSLLKTNQFECAVKRYKAGDREPRHVHMIATEFTVIAEGVVRMNGTIFGRDSIIEMPPGRASDFEVLEDAITFVVKVPAVLGDKYEVGS